MNTKFTVARTCFRAAVAFGMMATMLGSTSLAQAPAQYIEDKPDPKLKTWNDVGKTPSDERRAIESMMRGTLDDRQFEDFFNKVVFPQFTLIENIYAKSSVKGSKELKNTVCLLPAMRKDFNTIFFNKSVTQQARSKLNALTLAAMVRIANGNYHPIARYNAMVFIAELNQDDQTGNPFAPALPEMGRAAINPRLTDGVRVAALIGILRHARAESGIAANWQGPLSSKILIPLIEDTKRPANRSREGHDWIRRRALEALTAMYLKTPPTDDKFLKLLNTVLQEKDSVMELRAEAIESFLTVTFPAPVTVDSTKMAADIGQVGVDAYHRELATSSQFGRAVDSKGMTYYYTLVERGLAALDKLAPSPKIAELQKSLATLVEEATAEEEVDPETQQADPLFKERQFDKIAQSGAEFESAVTGKPVSEILPKRGPVGGNEVAAAGYTGGGGRGPGGVGYPRSSGDRSGGHMRLPPGAGRGGRGGYGLPSSGGRR